MNRSNDNNYRRYGIGAAIDNNQMKHDIRDTSDLVFTMVEPPWDKVINKYGETIHHPNTRTGRVQYMYKGFECRSPRPLTYTLGDLERHLKKQGYDEMFDVWTNSIWLSRYAPHAMLIDGDTNYTLNNVKLVNIQAIKIKEYNNRKSSDRIPLGDGII